MNAHQRRKSERRRVKSQSLGLKHYIVYDWEDLAKIPESDTHRLEIDVGGCNGWIVRKDGNEILGRYLSTHTFYGSNYKRMTSLLRSCGFNVTLANWDKPEFATTSESPQP